MTGDLDEALSLLESSGIKAVARGKPIRGKRRRNLHVVCRLLEKWTTHVVEQFFSKRKTTINLFGCLNIISVKASSKGTLGILALQGSRLKHAFERIRQSREIVPFLAAKNRLVIVLLDESNRAAMYVTQETLKTNGVIEFKP